MSGGLKTRAFSERLSEARTGSLKKKKKSIRLSSHIYLILLLSIELSAFPPSDFFLLKLPEAAAAAPCHLKITYNKK